MRFFRRKSSNTDDEPVVLPTTIPDVTSVAGGQTVASSITMRSTAALVSTSPRSTSSSKSTSCMDNGLGHIKYVNLVAYIVNVVVVYGVGVLGWYGSTNSEVSAAYPTLLTPAGWAFAIWFLIFLAQAAWVAQQFACKLPPIYLEKIGAVNCNYLAVVMTQCGWTLVFASQYISIAAIILLYLTMNLFVVVRSVAVTRPSNLVVYLTSQFPFSLHFGWLLAASAVGLNLSLNALQNSDAVQFYGALITLAILTILAVVLACAGYLVPPLVVAYALVAIFFQNNSNPIAGFSGDEINSIKYGSLSTAGFILMVVALQIVSSFRKVKQPELETDYYRVQDGAGHL